MKSTIIAATLTLLVSGAAVAQQRQFYDAAGRNVAAPSPTARARQRSTMPLAG
ncbi:hypothetical protein ABIF66_007003 [Bradyrhizobium japonicum]